MKITKMTTIVRWVSALLVLGSLGACERYMDKTSCSEYFTQGDLGRWQVDSQGLAVDPNTGLRWFRCNAGERFEEGQCLGEAHFMNKADAAAYVVDFAESAGKPWRLPSLDEMGSLRETACTNPAINTQIFPTAKVEQYWASDISRHGAQLACAYYNFSGSSYCRESVLNQRPFWLVLDK